MKCSSAWGARAAALALATSLVLGLGAAAPAGVGAQQGESEDLRALFPQRATIETSGSYGLVRAPLPAEVLSSVRADLADVRVFMDESPVEFVIEAGAPARVISSRLLTPVDVRERATGEVQRERVTETWDVQLPSDVSGVDAGSATGEPVEWLLGFGMTPAELVRELTIHTLDAQGAETELVSTTLFRFSTPLREKVTVAIPVSPGARLRVRLSGPSPALRPTLTLITRGSSAAPRELRIPLELAAGESAPPVRGETVLLLRRPRGVVPDSLVFETSTGALHREVIVEDAGVGSSGSVAGRAVVYRIPDWNEAALEVPLTRTQGDLLRVRIVNGDAPALEGLSVTARVRQPAVVFEAYGSAQLYFGGARATRPAYGLGDLLRHRLTPDAIVGEARVLVPSANPHFHAGPVLAFAMRPGASVNVAEFSHVQSLRVSETPEGLTRIRPGVAALAASQSWESDFRVVDAQGRQWPFLWGDERHERSVDVGVSARALPDPRSSVHAIAVPAGGLEVDHVLLDVDDALVRRPYQLWIAHEPEADLVELTRGTLERAPGTRDPLRVPVGMTVHALELRVTNGDEQPLTVRGAKLVAMARDLFLAAPAGDYRLLVGSDAVEMPAYDIESARDLVLSVRAEDATLGELLPNPDYAPPSPSRDAMTEAALLGVLALAVVLLGLLTFRLVRSDPEAPVVASASVAAAEVGDAAAAAARSEGHDVTQAPEGADDDAGGAPADERDKLPR